MAMASEGKLLGGVGMATGIGIDPAIVVIHDIYSTNAPLRLIERLP